MVSFIRKRDGKVVDFDWRKITDAILPAMKEVNQVDIKGAISIASTIADSINDETVDVETIQDMVENALINTYPEVAKAYIKYRHERTRIRRMNSDINKHIKEILSCSNIQNSNANVDEYSFGGRKNEASNLIQKDLALSEYVSPEIVNAYKENRIYIHDLSEYTNGSHNCIFADVYKLLNEGFTTRNGDVRGANCFATACQLVAVIFQAQSQV